MSTEKYSSMFLHHIHVKVIDYMQIVVIRVCLTMTELPVAKTMTNPKWD